MSSCYANYVSLQILMNVLNILMDVIKDAQMRLEVIYVLVSLAITSQAMVTSVKILMNVLKEYMVVIKSAQM